MSSSIDTQMRAAYLDLVKRTISNYPYLGGQSSQEEFRCVSHYDLRSSKWKIDRLAMPMTLLTRAQLDLIEEICVIVHDLGVAGDFLEAGVWRGGATILMQAIINAYQMDERRVFLADSFQGIPLNTQALNDPVDQWSDRWVASEEEVRGNFARMGLLDDQIVFAPGFFVDSLPALKGERFALLRLDSDSYDRVYTSLELLYPRLSRSGFVIIDDWHLPGCRMAVEDYRGHHRITGDILVQAENACWAKAEDFGYPR